MGTLASFARVLKENPGWDRFFFELNKLYFDQWVASTDAEEREKLHLKFEVSQDFRMLVENAGFEMGEDDGR